MILFVRSAYGYALRVNEGRSEKFDTGAARDLLGMVRAAYQVEASTTADPSRMRRLQAAGEHLFQAIIFSRRLKLPGSGDGGSWWRARKAAELLVGLGSEMELPEAMRDACERATTPLPGTVEPIALRRRSQRWNR